MSKKVNASATHSEPTLEVTQNLGEGVADKKDVKTLEQLQDSAMLELSSVNAAINAGQDPTDTLAHLRTAVNELNRKIVRDRASELAHMDAIDLFRTYIENPYVTCKSYQQSSDTGLYALCDAEKYVAFEEIVAVNAGIVCSGKWAQKARILRYNMAIFEIKDNGKATSNVNLKYEDFSARKEFGWDKQPTIAGLTAQLTELVAAILPPELCPKAIYKADTKQLMKAIMPENGNGHDTSNSIRQEKFFTRKLFAIIKTRLADGLYNYDDESAAAVARASKHDGKPTVKDADALSDTEILEQVAKRKLDKKVGLTVVEATAEGESAQS